MGRQYSVEESRGGTLCHALEVQWDPGGRGGTPGTVAALIYSGVFPFGKAG